MATEVGEIGFASSAMGDILISSSSSSSSIFGTISSVKSASDKERTLKLILLKDDVGFLGDSLEDGDSGDAELALALALNVERAAGKAGPNMTSVAISAGGWGAADVVRS